jgi:hypothetical protein
MMEGEDRAIKFRGLKMYKAKTNIRIGGYRGEKINEKIVTVLKRACENINWWCPSGQEVSLEVGSHQ